MMYHRNRRKRQETANNPDLVGLGKLLLSILGIGLLVVVMQRFMIGDVNFSYVPQDDDARPLAEFESLRFALENSRLVMLYFAASWCRMSTPVSERIDTELNEILLRPGTEPGLQRHGLSLVYVSSDTSAEEMERYIENRNWITVPYDSPERNELKRHFSTCSKPEIVPLGIERKREIPTIIVLDGETEQVLTYKGVTDLNEFGSAALDSWMELARISAMLDTKYVEASQDDDKLDAQNKPLMMQPHDFSA